MTQKATIALIAVLILAGAGLIFALRNNDTQSPDTNVVVDPNNTNGSNNNGTGTTTAPAQNSMIKVTSPLPNSVVRSPLTITGEARGGWYFEATFPVKILDANGKVLGQHYAEAQGEWTTTNFVPFKSTLTFTTPTTPTGTLVLMKDNPSGLPENDAEIRIPIRFDNVAANERVIKLYFYNQNEDKDSSGNVQCSADGLVAVNRTTPLTNTPIQDAIRELLKGPTAAERSQFPGTEFPLAGVTLASASLNSGVLTLTFNDPQNKTTGGSCRVQVLRAQIEATAKQFAGVSSVRIMPNTVFQP